MVAKSRAVISWRYIAGFFDGEGCASWTSNALRPQVLLTQAGSMGEVVLRAIQEFLQERQIKSSLHFRDPKLPRMRCWKLQMASHDNTLNFLRGIYPYLVVKRQLVEDSIRVMTIYPMRGKGLPFKTVCIDRGWTAEHASRNAESRKRWLDGISRGRGYNSGVPEIKQCVQCGKDFYREGRASANFRNKRFCSQACINDHRWPKNHVGTEWLQSHAL